MATTQLLRDLVALPSVNPMGRSGHSPEFLEGRVTGYLEDFFRTLGVPWQRQTVAPGRDNIIARWEAPGARRTLLWEVHQDTVPTDRMTIDPFAARVENGRLYGRGACDVKGGMAAMLAALARLVREKPQGAAHVILACTVDEEHNFLGVQRLVCDPLHADAAVVAEPTCLNIVKAHKGVCRWHLSTAGRSCHSSTPERGLNAIYLMGRLLPAIERYAHDLAARPPDPLLGPPTLSVGRLEGGSSVNTVPDWCRAEIDRRLIPGEDANAAHRDFCDWLAREAGPDTPFACPPPWMKCPALAAGATEELMARLGRCIDLVRGRHEALVVPFGTNASTLAEAGIPSVVFGPGDIAQAHTADEWIALEEVEQAAEIFYLLACLG